MAKRKYSKMKQDRIEPAVLTLAFNVPTGAATSTLDLSQVASVVNRRFYRQGINWAVAGFKLITPSGVTGSASVAKVPNTWVTSGSWMKAFSTWRKQQDEALAEGGTESMKARFNDFKVFADTTHVAAGFAANLRAIDFAGANYSAGTWEPSKIVLPNVNADASGSTVDPAQRFLHMVGVNVNGASSRGILEGYAASRSYPQSPDPVGPDVGDADNWLARMFDVGNDMEEVLDNATLRNDTLPYDQDDYPGGETNAPTLEYHDSTFVTPTTIGGISRMKGGNFPCGLVRLSSNLTAPAEGANLLVVDLIPGNHRGYLCEPMTEMN